MRDDKGKIVKSSQSVDYVGFREYVRALMSEAGLIDPELEELVDELKRVERNMSKLERFFGRTGALVKA